MEDIWVKYAKRLHALSSTGISYATDEFDKERYQEIQQISVEMMSLIGEVPIQRINELVSKSSIGYVTPKIDVRGAVFRDSKLLLVQEKSDGLWTLPGGFADVGKSAAENVVNEIREEAGIDTTATSLYSIRHKSKGAYDPDVRDFYKLFFICEDIGNHEIAPGSEITDARLFEQDEIPPLSTGRILEEDIELAWQFKTQVASPAMFD